MNSKSVINLSNVNLMKTGLIGLLLSLTACQTIANKMSDLNAPGFKKELTPEPRYIPNLVVGNAQILLISPQRISCNTQMPMQCMIAMVEGNNINSAFEIPYYGIEGFTPRVNTTYKISAKPLIDQNQQKNTGKWVLESILSQKSI